MKNDTANWITVTDVKAGNTKINGQTIMLPPLSTQNINDNEIQQASMITIVVIMK